MIKNITNNHKALTFFVIIVPFFILCHLFINYIFINNKIFSLSSIEKTIFYVEPESEIIADDVIPPSVRKHKSYNPKYGKFTRKKLEKLAEQGDVIAKKMKKLYDQGYKRLIEKAKSRPNSKGKK